MKHMTPFAVAAFLFAVPASAITTINFESIPTSVQPNPFTIGDVTFGSTGNFLVGPQSGGATGQMLCSFDSAGCAAPLTLTFASSVSDFSFLYYGVNTSSSSIGVVLNYADGGSATFSFSELSNHQIINLSAYSNILNAVITTNDGFGLAYDNFTYSIGSAVPEPATWLMLILGFGGIGVAMRRQRNAQRLAFL